MPALRFTKRLEGIRQLVLIDSPTNFTMGSLRWRQPKLVIGDRHWGTEILGKRAPRIQKARCMVERWGGVLFP